MSGDLSILARGRDRPEFAEVSAAERVPAPRRRWRTRVALPGVIFAATAGVLLYAAGDALWPATPVRVVPVVVKTGSQGGGGKVVAQAPGWVEADPYSTSVTALADGVVEEVLVLEGQAVTAGQVVARLVADDAQLALARAEAGLSQAEARLKTAQATLTAAQRDWDNPVELKRKLATAEAMHAEKQAELERWPAELAAEEALSAELEAEYRRLEPLYRSGTSSQIEFIQAEQRYRAQQAKTAAVRGRKPILEAQVRALEAEVAAARDNLRLRIADTRALDEARAAVASAEAELAAARAMRAEAALRLSRMEVRSPADGIVMTRLVEPGAKLMLHSDTMLSATVARLYDPQRLQVRVDVPLADAANVGVGQPAEVVVDVLPERVFAGTVTRIVNEADVQKNTLQVKVAIHDPAAELKPEMLARARFLSTEQQTAAATAVPRVFVPARVLQQGGGQLHVWLADQARRVALRRAVTPGRGEQDGWVEIESGLRPGDRVIADPPADIRDGQRIRIVGEAAADRPEVAVAGRNDGAAASMAAAAGTTGARHGTH